jgi:hypothetical protein
VPFDAAEQQPPEQGLPAPQVLVHWCEALHDWPPGQSPATLQPQAPAIQRWPTELDVQSTQAAPFEPQALGVLAVMHMLLEQQPPLQTVWLASPQVVSQLCVVVLQALPLGQSVAALQPQLLPLTQAEPAIVLPTQVWHTPPEPQVACAVPGLQVPPDEAVQHPPLHGCENEQEVVHWCVDVLQAVPDGQSVVELQPQVPVANTQMWPLRLAVQSTHAPPEMPQLDGILPPLQVVPAQQPPLHGCDEEQVPVQACFEMSQAVSDAQSVAALQPQAVPLMQRWPAAFEVQLVQAMPSPPQVAAAVPALQLPEVMPVGMLQQPLAHGVEASQPEPHRCVVVLQAVPGQSAEVMQPQPTPVTHWWPLAFVEQSVQLRPFVPHAVGEVPGEHMPPVQQPPLHACDAVQVVVHWCIVVLQAEPIAQSVVPLQPQLPPPVTAEQRVPFGLVVQSLQEPPEAPQVVCAVPATQVPAEQQPPLHSCVAVQVFVQRWKLVSHA